MYIFSITKMQRTGAYDKIKNNGKNMKKNPRWQKLLEYQLAALNPTPSVSSAAPPSKRNPLWDWQDQVEKSVKQNNVPVLEHLLKAENFWQTSTLKWMSFVLGQAEGTFALLAAHYLKVAPACTSYEQLERAWVKRTAGEDREKDYYGQIECPEIFGRMSDALKCIEKTQGENPIDLFFWGCVGEQKDVESLAFYEQMALRAGRSVPSTQQWFAMMASWGDWESLARLSAYRSEVPVPEIFQIQGPAEVPQALNLVSPSMFSGQSGIFLTKLCAAHLKDLPASWIEKLYENSIKHNDPALYALLRVENLLPEKNVLNVHCKGQKESMFFSTRALAHYYEPMHMVSYALACLPSDSALLELVLKDKQLVQSLQGYQEHPKVLATLPSARLTAYKKLGGRIDLQDAQGNNVFHYWAKSETKVQAGWGLMHFLHQDLMQQKNGAGKTPLDLQRAKLKGYDQRKPKDVIEAGGGERERFDKMLAEYEAKRLNRAMGKTGVANKGSALRL